MRKRSRVSPSRKTTNANIKPSIAAGGCKFKIKAIIIEHVDALDNLPEILGVAGVDDIFVGPYDLAASMGKMGPPGDADVEKAIARITASAQQHNMPLGIFGATADAVKPYIDQGYALIAVGMDTLLLGRAAKDINIALT